MEASFHSSGEEPSDRPGDEKAKQIYCLAKQLCKKHGIIQLWKHFRPTLMHCIIMVLPDWQNKSLRKVIHYYTKLAGRNQG